MQHGLAVRKQQARPRAADRPVLVFADCEVVERYFDNPSSRSRDIHQPVLCGAAGVAGPGVACRTGAAAGGLGG